MDLKSFYSTKVDQHSRSVRGLKTNLRRLSFIRLLVFLSTAFAVYKISFKPIYVIVVLTCGVLIFLALLLRYLKHKKTLAIEEALLKINKD